MFYMDSKTFRDLFLNHEKDKDILDAQYVLVSTRIRQRDHQENVIKATPLIPDSRVCSSTTDEDFKERYYEQLEGEKTLLATLILGSIEEGYNIIFLCSKSEGKMKHLKYISNYAYLEFGYPIYNYKLYASGASELIEYNKDKVIKKCRKLIKIAKNNQYEKNLGSEQGRKRIIKELKKRKKSDLKKELKKRNLYSEGMSRKDMIETMEDFL